MMDDMNVISSPTSRPWRVSESRSYDGSNNNLEHQDWGQKDQVFLRQVPADYADGQGAPSGADRPNPRHISNELLNQRGRDHDERQLSGMVWGWGQFIDHDMTFTPNTHANDWNIAVPRGDRHFDPDGTGQAEIPFSRSTPMEGFEGREQFNGITGWLDASMVYGSDAERAAALRTFEGGRLATSDGDRLPFNTQGLANENPVRRPAESLHLAGDVRANENVALLSLHTVFLREHNRLVGEFAKADPTLDDEQLYQKARKMVGAQVQAITYNEFLPALLGEGALPSYQGYSPEVDPRISNVFSTAAYRMGHSQIEPIVWREGADGNAIPERDLALLHAFFNPAKLNEGGIDPLLRGLMNFIQEPTDEKVSIALRNMLFGRPGSGGLDLASLNIARGRDHGLPGLNAVREAFGLKPYQSFEEISTDPEVSSKLAELYQSPDQVDPWVGMLCEDHLPGAAVGESLKTILVDQFQRLRDGDRFWYGNDPDLAGARQEIESTSLMDVIRRNTDIGDEVDDTPFFGHKTDRRTSR